MNRRTESGRSQGLTSGVIAAETATAVPHRVLPVQMAADQHPEPGARATAGLFRELERPPLAGDDVVAPDDAFVFDTENLIEIDPPERHECRRGVGGRAAELGVEGRHEALAHIPIGRGERRDAGDPELVDEAIL